MINFDIQKCYTIFGVGGVLCTIMYFVSYNEGLRILIWGFLLLVGLTILADAVIQEIKKINTARNCITAKGERVNLNSLPELSEHDYEQAQYLLDLSDEYSGKLWGLYSLSNMLYKGKAKPEILE